MKKQFVLWLVCCWLFSIVSTICFWIFDWPVIVAYSLLLLYTFYSIAECVMLSKKIELYQMTLILIPAKFCALILSVIMCKELHFISLPTPEVSINGMGNLFFLYVPWLIGPAAFTVIKKAIEVKTKWGKLYFWGNLVVFVVSQFVVQVITWLLSWLFW